MITSSDDRQLEAFHTFITDGSVSFDAVYVDGGAGACKMFEKDAVDFVKEAFKHYKPIAATNEGKMWIENEKLDSSVGVFLGSGEDGEFLNRFIEGIAEHRYWERELV